jgi:hypothetical protein
VRPIHGPGARSLATLCLLIQLCGVQAQPAVYEAEPNDTPAQANPVSGAVTLFGVMDAGDQDGFLWTVSDDDARKRWTFELHGIPGRLTVVDVLRVQFAENGTDVAGTERLMKMGTRDGLAPSIARDLLFEPGEYLIGLAYAGGGSAEGGGAFRPPVSSLSFGAAGQPEVANDAVAAPAPGPGGYRFLIREGSPLHVDPTPGSRSDRESAQPLHPGRAFATFETQRTAWYAFTFGERDAAQRWDITVQVPVGRELRAALLDSGGQRLAQAQASDHGHLVFADIAPEIGSYFVQLESATTEFIQAIASEAVGQRVEGEEAEPNGEWRLANRVDLSQPLTGRIGTDGEGDYFRFAVDETGDDRLRALRVESEPAGQPMEFCLLTRDGAPSQCRRADTPIELPDLVLTPGDWGLVVARAKAGLEYRITLEDQGPVEAGMEAEPNDAIEFASSVPANHRVKGRFSGTEDDYFRFTVVDEPQLWRFQVLGDDIHEVTYYDGAGQRAANVRVGRGERRVRLDNLFLMPGRHHLRVSGRDGGSYTVLARALGPPDPDGEREPNDDESRMQRLAVGQTRKGLLSDRGDVDYYRFFIAHWDHVRLTVQPPPDGMVQSEVYWYGSAFAQGRPASAGEPVSMSGLLPPGDYHVVLRPGQVSDAEYRLSLQRLPRYSCTADCEPGRLSPTPDVPAEIAPLGSRLELRLEHDKVSAFRLRGQRVAGQLLLENGSERTIDVQLEAASSDYRWQVRLDHLEVTMPAGGRAAVPLEVLVPADAWADRPVRISARAFDRDGAQAETWRDMTVDRDVPAVAPRFAWEIPESLRGGFNAAWSALGSRWAGALPRGINYELLLDGLVFGGSRVECCGVTYGWKDEERPELTLELAGDSPIPVAGVAWNHFGSPRPLRNVRKATLLLSMDGTRFEEALRLETLPVQTEQYFPLEAPVMARFARLRLEETYGTPSGGDGVTMAEWKVIAQPGFDLSGGAGFNLADPALGGHLVSDWPPEPYSPVGVLNEKRSWAALRLKAGEAKDYVVGFQDNRAAQIRRVEWVYAEDVDAARKFDRVVVSVSLDSPVGPWHPVGEMAVAGATVAASLQLDTPAWARFVKLSASKDSLTGPIASPATIRIWERPSGPDYRSALTEWGYASRDSFYEFQAGLEPEPAVRAAANDSRARAARLSSGQRAAGEVALAKHEHWYRLQLPPGENALSLRLYGSPTVRTRVELEDAAGQPVDLRRLEDERRTGLHAFEAFVEPGCEVFLRVYEPPRNVVFSWDTSASTIAYLPTIYNALTAFSSQVIPGQEAVNLVPFGRSALLKEWHGEPYVLQTILNDYPRSESSSAAELTLKLSSRALAPLAGSKSIVVITDGETVHDGSMWKEMAEVQPQVFGVHIVGSEGWHQDVFQDWASVNGGHYTQLVYQGEMEVAFDRAATLMRRPADYALEVTSERREAPGPGLLRVVAGNGKAASGGGAVELILDASGSMLQRMEGRRRIDVAKEVLTSAVTELIPAGTPTALRVFGHRTPNACETDLEAPLAPLAADSLVARIRAIEAKNLARTPIGASLAAVRQDLKGSTGAALVVLVTDGEETCDGDPAAEIAKLQQAGVKLTLNIVGFAIDDDALALQFETWAAAGGGRYYPATDPEGLRGAIRQALATSYTVYDSRDNEVTQGIVGGDPVELMQGTYRVEVATAPPRVFTDVEVTESASTALEL